MDKKSLLKLHKQLSVSLATVEQMLAELGHEMPTEPLQDANVITGSTDVPEKVSPEPPVATEPPPAAPKPILPPKPEERRRELPADIEDPDWPIALPDSVIVKTDSQKWARANTILTKFETMRGPILDFGCGEGHSTVAIKDLGRNCIGYDIKEFDTWHKISSAVPDTFFVDWDTVASQGPFASVLLHDVIDHVEQESVQDVLNKVADVLTDDGRVYVMCHPFSSRHGGHLYEAVNKAYLHLLLTDEQLREMYPDIPPNQKIVKPQGQYQKFLTERFTIEQKKVIPQNIEPWIHENLMEAIQERWYSNLKIDQVEKVLRIGGIYYTLKKV